MQAGIPGVWNCRCNREFWLGSRIQRSQARGSLPHELPRANVFPSPNLTLLLCRMGPPWPLRVLLSLNYDNSHTPLSVMACSFTGAAINRVSQTEGIKQQKEFPHYSEGRNLRSRCQQVGFLRPHSLICRWTSSTRVFTWLSLCACLCPNVW